MYAGAAQFISIGLFAAGTPLVAILVTMALVNLRHIVYGLSLIGKFKGCGKWRPYLIFGLTDETYSLLTTVDVPAGVASGRFYGIIALLNQFYWVSGSLIGALLGKFLPFDMTGADFALTALFVVLTIEQVLKSRQWGPVIVGTGCTIGTVLLWKFGVIGNSSNILMISLVAAGALHAGNLLRHLFPAAAAVLAGRQALRRLFRLLFLQPSPGPLPALRRPGRNHGAGCAQAGGFRQVPQ